MLWLADILGQIVGNLLAPLVWIIGIGAGLKVPPKWLWLVALIGALLLEAVLAVTEPPELRMYRFGMLQLTGRFLAISLIGYGTVAVVAFREKRRATNRSRADHGL